MADDDSRLECDYCKGPMGRLRSGDGRDWWCGWCGTVRLTLPGGSEVKWFYPSIIDEKTFRELAKAYTRRVES